jgi:hypothetical protein
VTCLRYVCPCPCALPIHGAPGTSTPASPPGVHQAFGYYVAVPVAIFVTAPLLWPSRKYEQPENFSIDDVIFDSVAESPREQGASPREQGASDRLQLDIAPSNMPKTDMLSRKKMLKMAPFRTQVLSLESLKILDPNPSTLTPNP